MAHARASRDLIAAFLPRPPSNVLSQPNNPTTITWPRYYEAHQRQPERTTQRASALNHLNKNIRYKQYAASGHLHCGCPTIKIILNEPIMSTFITRINTRSRSLKDPARLPRPPALLQSRLSSPSGEALVRSMSENRSPPGPSRSPSRVEGRLVEPRRRARRRRTRRGYVKANTNNKWSVRGGASTINTKPQQLTVDSQH
ncbi:hypothetical protein PNOK_0911300 [Pyrrhoderma noxium]|uniref:Uncharacterized protein n=1 Tax=Pyrrhoderma noxium TaxID=2282107 RepID=A0A286U705_9AGAM|nr:hypothetical protein PNOK_0911300 [Pyrrhoderma noxium]